MYTVAIMADIVRMELRLPKDLRDRLAAIADAEERSMNQQIVYLLRAAIDAKRADVRDALAAQAKKGGE